MTDEPFGRQPRPVTLTFEGDKQDIKFYMEKIKRMVEHNSYDHAVIVPINQLVIYPRAVND